MYQVRFYLTSRGDSPVREFIETLDEHTQAKVAQLIGLLKEMGPQLKRPFADKVEGKIYELRPRQARILYFFVIEKEVILVHGFLKKENSIDRSDIGLAQRRMADWLLRNRR